MILVFSILCIICAYGVLAFALTAQAKTPSEKVPESTQELVTKIAKSYGQNPALALAIIKCEGEKYKQVGNNKNISNGTHWSTDIGLFQINDYYHETQAEKLGIDIHTDKGNIVYAMWLMKSQGTKPWNASKSCWSKIV